MLDKSKKVKERLAKDELTALAKGSQKGRRAAEAAEEDDMEMNMEGGMELPEVRPLPRPIYPISYRLVLGLFREFVKCLFF